jgi:hypothetical protein
MTKAMTVYKHTWETPEGVVHEDAWWENDREKVLQDRRKRIEWSVDPEVPEGHYYPFEESWPFEIRERTLPVLRLNHERQAIVFLTEEFGYREWLWYTGMTGEELAAFWRGLKTVEPFFHDPRVLPGTLIPVWIDACFMTFNPDGFSPDEEGEEVAILGTCDEGDLSQCWSGHIHMDNDSGLCSPAGDGITHAGFKHGIFQS